VESFINAEQAHFMILKNSLELKKKKILVAGEIQDGRLTTKCSRFVKKNPNNLQLRILED
jgi:hypothetical protein